MFANPLAFRRGLILTTFTVAVAAFSALRPGQACAGFLAFDTELTSLNLTGGPFLMPLASDPANQLGDSVDGYGFVKSQVSLTLSSQRSTNPGAASTGLTRAFQSGVTPPPIPSGDLLPIGFPNGSRYVIDPSQLDGEEFFVDSFFDVFFDMTLTDVDTRPGRDFAGLPDGTTLVLSDNGPTTLQTFYTTTFHADSPNFGLFPAPEADPFVGLFDVEIPLGGDINGNGENDKIKFTLGQIAAVDDDRQFTLLPDGAVLNQFTAAALLEGAVVDESTDPAFTIGMTSPTLPDPSVFGGTATATSTLLNPVTPQAVPEPSSLTLLASGLAAVICCGWRKRRFA